MSHDSDWKEPLDMCFSLVSFDYQKDQIIAKYLEIDVLNLIYQIDTDGTINTTNEIGLLIREKEIIKADLKDQEQEFFQGLLIIGLLFIVTVAGLLYYNNYQKSKTNALLQLQKKQIQEQQDSIEIQNNSLVFSNKKLKEFNDQKNDLIGVLSHDLRAPINQIKGFAQIYKGENNDLSESQTDLIDRIISTSDRLTDMIRKIMDVEAIDANKLNLKMERINLSKLLSDIAMSFAELADHKKIKIEAKFNTNDFHIEANKTYLTQVFENLVSNAIKFSNPDTTVEIKIQPIDDKILSIIKDQGPGLTVEDKKQLFKKHQKLSAAPTGGEQSTGLGPSIVNSYVKKMNGKVWAESPDGKGSSFIVEFNKVA